MKICARTDCPLADLPGHTRSTSCALLDLQDATRALGHLLTTTRSGRFIGICFIVATVLLLFPDTPKAI